MATEPTQNEIAASRAFGEALIRLLVAHENGKRQRLPLYVQPRLTEPAPSPQKAEYEDTRLLLSAKEAAHGLSISVRSLHTHSKPRGPIPAVRLGGRVLYSIDDLRAWIEQAKSIGTPAAASERCDRGSGGPQATVWVSGGGFVDCPTL